MIIRHSDPIKYNSWMLSSFTFGIDLAAHSTWMQLGDMCCVYVVDSLMQREFYTLGNFTV